MNWEITAKTFCAKVWIDRKYVSKIEQIYQVP